MYMIVFVLCQLSDMIVHPRDSPEVPYHPTPIIGAFIDTKDFNKSHAKASECNSVKSSNVTQLLFNHISLFVELVQ